MSYTDETCCIYPAVRPWRWVWLVASVVGSLLLLAPVLRSIGRGLRPTNPLFWAVAFVLVLVGWVIWSWWKHPGTTLLITSASGVEYHSPLLVIQTSWENVATLDDHPLHPQLRLYSPAATYVHPLGPQHPAALQQIPLAPFGYHHKSLLAHDLKSHLASNSKI